jgi:transcriptional regulator with XRE-family HTH domain
MTIKDGTNAGPSHHLPLTKYEQPLLRLLVAEANKRGDSLTQLAKRLGVSYARLAQWGRNEGQITNAHQTVQEKAAEYLGLPPVLIRAFSMNLKEFVWPERGSLHQRVRHEMDLLKKDPFLGPFVPLEMAAAAPAVQLFVVFLYRELNGSSDERKPAYQWLNALHRAAVGNVEAEAELQRLRKQAMDDPSVF